MKKLVLFAAVAVAISLSACKKAAPQEEPKPDEEAITIIDDATTGDEVIEVDDVLVEDGE